MKKFIFLLGIILVPLFMSAQSGVDSLIQAGIKYHDSGEFDKAIALYRAALKTDPNSATVHYEIASSLMAVKEYTESIEHCDRVIALEPKRAPSAIVIKGSCLDYLGETDASIKLFKNAIKQYGPNHLIYFNLGFDYYRRKDFKEAQEALINGINTRPSYPSCHLLLGFLMQEQGNKVQSLLCLYYFLMLEPNSNRSNNAYASLKSQFSENVERDKEKPNETHIHLNTTEIDGEFGPANMMISMLEASKTLEENKGKTEAELFVQNTTDFFKVLGELKKKKNKGLWWDFYVPFFYTLAETDNIEAYCYYISKSSGPTANEWLVKNDGKLQKFFAWTKK